MQRPYLGTGFWAVILGGSGGIGWAVARQLAASGMHLCLVYRERRAQAREFESNVEQLRSSGVSILTFNEDAGNPDTMQKVIDELKQQLSPGDKIRLLLHSVAKGNLKSMNPSDDHHALSTQDFQLTLDAMALSWYRWTQEIIQQKIFAPDARLLALTSEGSRIAWPGYGAVATVKAALEAMARNMAVEFAPLGIRCNVLQPGVTDTVSMRMIPGSEEMKKMAAQRNPFKRLTAPEDVARVVDLMCRDEAAWINGAIIPVDGGESISA